MASSDNALYVSTKGIFLKLLKNAGDEVGLPIVTEVLDVKDLDLICKYADMLQIGARNCQNYALLKEAGKSKKPVLLKRGMSTSLNEFLLCAEYLDTLHRVKIHLMK